MILRMSTQKLSDRQAVIFRLLTDKGLSPRQVANALNISTQGVYKHIAAIEAKGYLVQTQEESA